jgi:hypothetical protein
LNIQKYTGGNPINTKWKKIKMTVFSTHFKFPAAKWNLKFKKYIFRVHFFFLLPYLFHQPFCVFIFLCWRSDRIARCVRVLDFYLFFLFHFTYVNVGVPFHSIHVVNAGREDTEREKSRVSVCVFHHPITPFFTCQPNEANIKQLTARDCLTLFFFLFFLRNRKTARHVSNISILLFFNHQLVHSSETNDSMLFPKKKKKMW